MKTCKLLLLLGFVFSSVWSLAQTSNACSPVGTWYGGSDYKYMMTITPTTGDKYAIRYEAVFANGLFGYNAWTSWSGELKKQKNGRYSAQIISMYTTSTELPPPGTSYEMDAVRETMEFASCDNLQATIYFFSAYLDLSKVPFIDLPDFSYLGPGETIIETYRRMPVNCIVCSSATAPTSQLRSRH